jgi:hypothetical protein
VGHWVPPIPALTPDIKTAIRTLLLNGYAIQGVRRTEPATTVDVQRTDEFGAIVEYSLLFATAPEDGVLAPFRRQATEKHATPIGIGTFSAPFKVISESEFFRLLGGSIDEDIVHDDDLPDKLNALGHNDVPAGLQGDADDLLEEFTKQCLQFATARRSRRYGRDRLFQPVPDAIVLGDLFMLIDTKAYRNGFSIQADDIRRFASYVNDFNDRYKQVQQAVYSFIVVSGSFPQSRDTLDARRGEFYAACSTQLTCLTARDLGRIVGLLRKAPATRRLINWKRAFACLQLTPEFVEQEISRITADGVR